MHTSTIGSSGQIHQNRVSNIPDRPSIFYKLYQLEEVYARTLMHSRLLGTAFQSRTSHSLSSRLILRFSHRCPIPSINIHGRACTQDILYHQLDIALCPLYQSWTPPSQVPAVLDKETLVTAQAVMGHADPTGCEISHSTPLVQQTRSSSRSPPASSGIQPVLLHRCISNRMGSQLAESSSLRAVVSPRFLSAHQLAGARGHPISCFSVGTSVAQSDCSHVLRQQCSSGLHPQTGWNPFHFPVHQNSGTISSSGPVCDSSHSNPSSRSQECDSRCTVSNQQPQSHRMEDSSGNLTQSVVSLRDPLVDMFAMAENKVTPVYVSPYPEDRAWAVDALSISWDGLGLVYSFPPTPIVPKTLQKIKDSHNTTVILIASQQLSRPWHPLLLQLSLRPPILTNVALFQYIPNIRRPHSTESFAC